MPLDDYGLGPERAYGEITYEDFYEICRRYGPTLPTNDSFENLEDLRLHTIPETIQQRKAAGCAFIEKVELQILGEYRRYLAFPALLLANGSSALVDVERQESSLLVS